LNSSGSNLKEPSAGASIERQSGKLAVFRAKIDTFELLGLKNSGHSANFNILNSLWKSGFFDGLVQAGLAS
jgi:hypothetical protein